MIPAAIKKIIKSRITTAGIRLDSGDLYYLSVEARLFDGVLVETMLIQRSSQAETSMNIKFMICCSQLSGTELSTSRDDPAMNGVYKLIAIKIPFSPSTRNEARIDEKILYKFKTSRAKRTYPCP